MAVDPYLSGTYGTHTTESNSLVANGLKYPEIRKTMIRQFPQYSLTYFTEGLGRYAKGVKLVGDGRVRWTLLGRLTRPATCTGTYSGTGASFATFTVEFKENYFNKHDIVQFHSGTRCIVVSDPVETGVNWTYTFKLETASSTATITAADFAASMTGGVSSNAFYEGSDKGYEDKVFPDWYDNYLHTMRKSISITGSALTDVSWVTGDDGSKLWWFTEEKLGMENFLYQQEQQRWYSKRNVSSDGTMNISIDGKPVPVGDGFLAQIATSNVDTYTGALTEDQIRDFMMQLNFQGGKKKGQPSKWQVHTGSLGARNFDAAMKASYVQSGAANYDINAGGEVALGGDFRTYHSMGHGATLIINPLFDDPNIHTDIDASTGLPKESGMMVFVDDNVDDGISNVEIYAKGAEGMSRNMITKHIPGMVDPYNWDSIKAATSKDAFTVEYLCESCVVTRNPKNNGILRLV